MRAPLRHRLHARLVVGIQGRLAVPAALGAVDPAGDGAAQVAIPDKVVGDGGAAAGRTWRGIQVREGAAQRHALLEPVAQAGNRGIQLARRDGPQVPPGRQECQRVIAGRERPAAGGEHLAYLGRSLAIGQQYRIARLPYRPRRRPAPRRPGWATKGAPPEAGRGRSLPAQSGRSRAPWRNCTTASDSWHMAYGKWLMAAIRYPPSAMGHRPTVSLSHCMHKYYG